MNIGTSTLDIGAKPAPIKTSRRAVFAAAMGTVFEWYEFTLYGALTSVIAINFFTDLTPTIAFIFALLIFAVGFIMRRLRSLTEQIFKQPEIGDFKC